MEAVSLGHHLNPPEGCPDVIKTIMLSCWKLGPNERINFSTIADRLSEDNLEKILATSSSMYGKLKPLSYTDKSRHLISNRVNKSNLLVEKNKPESSEQGFPMLPDESCNSTCNSPVGSKYSSDPLLADSSRVKKIEAQTPETEYTIIIANDDSQDEE